MKKENNIYLALIFLLVVLMALFFPIVGTDITWKLTQVDDLRSLFEMRNVGLITGAIITLFSKYNLARVIGTGFLTALLLGSVKNTVNKKNTSLILLAGCSLLLLDRTFFASIFASYTGFVKYFVEAFLLVVFMNIIMKNGVARMNKLALFMFGLIATSLGMAMALIVLVVTIVFTLYTVRERERYSNCIALLIGEVLGVIFTAYRYDFIYTGFSVNLMREFVPAMMGTNFLIVLIFSGLVMLQIPKMYAASDDKGSLLALVGMSVYLFVSLLLKNVYANYVSFAIYLASSFYVLYNFTNSRAIKKNVAIVYAFKLLFILFMVLFGSIEVGSTFFLYLLDIILIAMCYDYIWPTRFLEPLWGAMLLVLLVSNIYIYSNVFYKDRDMNFYIKNRLECYLGDVQVPTLYKNNYLYKSIPSSDKEIEEYIEYHHIDVYDKENSIAIYFKE